MRLVPEQSAVEGARRAVVHREAVNGAEGEKSQNLERLTNIRFPNHTTSIPQQL